MGGIVDSVTSIFKGPPKAPSASATIEAQKQANRLNQITPGGNISYGNFDEQGNFIQNQGYDTVKVTESPEQEALRKQREALAGQFFGGVEMQQPFFTPAQLQTGLTNVSQWESSLPSVGTTGELMAVLPQGGNIASVGQGLTPIDTDYTAANERAASSIFNRGMNYLRPEFETQTSRIDAQLAARGIPVGSEAYAAEKDRLMRGQGQQLENLALSSIGAGNQEAARLFGQDLAARGQQFGEQATTFGLAEGQQDQRFGQGMQALNFEEAQRRARLAEQQAILQSQLQKQGFLNDMETRNEATAQNRAKLAAALATTNPMFVNTPSVDAAGAMNTAYQNQTGRYQSDLGSFANLGKLFMPGF